MSHLSRKPIYQNDSVFYEALIEDEHGQRVQAAQVDSIDYAVFRLRGNQQVSSGILSPAEQFSSEGDYNFSHLISNNIFSEPNQIYRVEYVFAGEDSRFIASFEVSTLEVLSD